MNKSFLEYLNQRGFYNQCTNYENFDLSLKKPLVGYAGFDCTADSLHVGSLVQIMLLRAFQKFGHKPIILLGGGTSLIGDPSGKDETRNILNIKTVNYNKNKLLYLFKKFINFDKSRTGAILVDNFDWIKKINYLDFIRDIGSQFSVNRMLSFDSVKLRLQREQNLSFLEFNYVLIQSYDFLELYKRMECTVQFGGSDQWGNIVSGIELIKKKKNQEVFGLTSPLITTSNGGKMGKTNQGAIWLTSEKLSPYEYWQFWRNTSDSDVIRFLKLFTELPIEQINKFQELKGKDLNEAKILLANEATKICHGENNSTKAYNSSIKIFNNNQIDESIPEKNIFKVDSNYLKDGFILKEALIKINFSNSNGESKRLIINGGVRINNIKISDKDYKITESDFGEEKKIKISVGKKKYGLITIN